MDLDNIKKRWQETEIKPAITEEKIKKMISNEGQSAFNSLLRYEKIGIISTILCIPLGYLVFEKHLPVAILIVASCIIGLFWQIYKYKKLKKNNISEMGITEISCNFFWYRKALLKEFYTGLVWFVFFFIFFGYFELLYDSVYFYTQLAILIICMLIGLGIALLLYKTLFWKNIKKLEVSIKEVEEFEKDNQK